MLGELRSLAGRLTSMVTRGKVVTSTIGARTLLQVTGLDKEVFDGVEYVLPYGLVGSPLPGADVIILQVNGSRDHKVALAGDNTPDTIAGLEPGEMGLSIAGQTILMRKTGIVATSPLAMAVAAPEMTTTGNVVAGSGATGTFSTPTGQMVTVRDGLITNIF